MPILIQLKQLLRDLRTQKMRTLMTTFGIVWGTTAVSLLLAFGQGFHEQIYKSSAGLGENICIAWPSRTSIPYQGLGKGRVIRMDEGDMELIAAKADGLLAISGEYESSFKLEYGKTTMAADVQCKAVEWYEVRCWPTPGPGDRSCAAPMLLIATATRRSDADAVVRFLSECPAAARAAWAAWAAKQAPVKGPRPPGGRPGPVMYPPGKFS